jgi:transposase InsO family protein
MGGIGTKQRSYLEGRFGKRVCFRRTERKLYGHDIAAIPSLIKPLVGNTTPDAVVQPETEAELIELVRWRRHYNVTRPHSSLGYRPPAPETVLPWAGSMALSHQMLPVRVT